MRYFLVFLFCIVAQLSVAQNRILDSLYATLKDHPQKDTVRVNILFNICYKEYTSRPEKNRMLAEEAMKISNEINYPKGLGYSNRYISLYYWSTGDYGKAAKYAYEMLEIFERIPFKRGVGQAYHLLGVIHEEEADLVDGDDFEKAKSYYSKALEIYKQENLKRDLGYGYNSLGSLFIKFSKYDEAEGYFLESLKVREEINDEDGLSQSYANLAVIYINQKKYEMALRYFEKSLPIHEKLNNQYRLAVSYMNMGKLYTLTDIYDKAERYLLKSVTLAKRIDQDKILEEAYSKLSLLEKERGNFETALKYFETASYYRDSIHTEEKAKQIAEVEARYETEKKDQLIQLLERDNQIRVLWTNILIGAFVLLAIVSAVIYFLQRFREKKNHQILNLEIDNLTIQHKELSEKYKSMLTSGNVNSIDSVDQRLLKKAIEVIEHNISDPLFGVEKMAREMGMSRTNMHRKIKAITGFPPSELIRNIRLRKAATLLLHENDTVSQISLAVGFEDNSYFSKAFKKQFGVSPSDYLQSVQREEVLN